jgi:hypothetical protein
MFGSIIPAFPAIGVPDLEGISTHLFQQEHITAVGAVDGLGLSVSVSLEQDGIRAVFFMDAPDLGSDDISSLIPGDSLILAFSPVLGVALTVGVPVNPFLEGT